MNTKLLFLLLSCSCALQGPIFSETERISPVETISRPIFAPSVAPLEPVVESTAESAQEIIRATLMEGPFSTVEDYCEWLFRTSERFNPVVDDNRCEYSSFKSEGGLSTQLVFATFDSREGEYHIAIETEEGWYVADSQYLDDLSDGGLAASMTRRSLAKS